MNVKPHQRLVLKLFQEDVLDVSTDLDVLEAMMSQEGLIEDELGSLSQNLK